MIPGISRFDILTFFLLSCPKNLSLHAVVACRDKYFLFEGQVFGFRDVPWCGVGGGPYPAAPASAAGVLSAAPVALRALHAATRLFAVWYSPGMR